MVSHDARRTVRPAMQSGAYRPGCLLTRVHRGLQGAAGLLAGVVGGRGLGLGSHDRGPSTVGRVHGTRRLGRAMASQGRSGIAGLVRGDASRVGGPGWLEVPREALVTACAKPNHRSLKLSFSPALCGRHPADWDVAFEPDAVGISSADAVCASQARRRGDRARVPASRRTATRTRSLRSRRSATRPDRHGDPHGPRRCRSWSCGGGWWGANAASHRQSRHHKSKIGAPGAPPTRRAGPGRPPTRRARPHVKQTSREPHPGISRLVAVVARSSAGPAARGPRPPHPPACRTR
jgi:hypothetical protein